MSNHLTLIEQVGGIEKAKAIVGGAPEGATIISLATLQYFRKIVNPLYDNEPNGFIRIRVTENGNLEHSTRFASIISPINLNDLRTAIAQHEQGSNSSEFKVGDLVVLEKWHDDNNLLNIQRVFFETDCKTIKAVKKDSNISRYGHKKNFRHATPAEVKAGRRLDHSEDVTDHVTDITNHISPNTKVINHG